MLSNLLRELLVKELINKSTRGEPIKDLTTERPVKELIEELIGPLLVEEIVEYIKQVYPSDNIVQRIIACKAAKGRKLLVDLVK